MTGWITICLLVPKSKRQNEHCCHSSFSEAGRQTRSGIRRAAEGQHIAQLLWRQTDLLDYTVDRSPHKQGQFLPGVHIPIYTPERIRQTKPNYVLILPWNLRDEVMQQMSYVLEWVVSLCCLSRK